MSYIDIYNARMSYNGSTDKERIINDGISNFQEFLKDAPNKETIKVENIDYDCVIQDVSFNDKNKDDKILLVSLDTPFNIGTVCEWGIENWLITSVEKNIIPTHKTFKITQCTNTITLYHNQTQILLEIPCIVSGLGTGMGLSTEENKYILEPSDTIYIRIPNNTDTQLIKINDVYKIGLWNYEVLSISDIIENGLLVLKMKFTAEEQSIPEIVEPTPTVGLSVEILGVNSITKGSSKTYNAVFKNNGVILTDTSNYYLTSDDGVSTTTLAEITSQDGVLNTCVVKGINLGYVKLWVKNSNETVISEPLRIKIVNLF